MSYNTPMSNQIILKKDHFHHFGLIERYYVLFKCLIILSSFTRCGFDGGRIFLGET
jgi:hypothetical protein